MPHLSPPSPAAGPVDSAAQGAADARADSRRSSLGHRLSRLIAAARRIETIRLGALLATAGLMMGAGLALGAEPPLKVENAWIRFIIAARPAAGYFTLTNDTDDPVVLTGASSPGCGTLMLHQTVNKGGTDQMAMVDSVSVPAHGSIDFSPGGFHLMCMHPAAETRPGKDVPVTLSFADGKKLETEFPVRGAMGK